MLVAGGPVQRRHVRAVLGERVGALLQQHLNGARVAVPRGDDEGSVAVHGLGVDLGPSPAHEVLHDRQVLGTPPLDGERQRGMTEAVPLLDVSPGLKRAEVSVLPKSREGNLLKIFHHIYQELHNVERPLGAGNVHQRLLPVVAVVDVHAEV